MSDLPRRLAVAVVGIPVVVGLLYLGGWPLTLPVAVLAALGAREVFALASARGTRAFPFLGMAGAAAVVVAAGWGGTYPVAAPALLAVVAGVAGLAFGRALASRTATDGPLGAVAVTVTGVVYVGLPLAAVPLLHALPAHAGWGGAAPSPWMGTMAVALPLAATWVGDSAAYFAGSAWGRNGPKLAPAISPNKSWVGAVAGLVGAGAAGAVWFVVAGPFLPDAPLRGFVGVVATGALLGAGAQAGDLAESLLKREAGVKDSGTLFPGHGGALDRLDALVVSLPLAYVILSALDAFS
ncbi:MAG: phosphatidate cytidylyltransferase [Longimicrobiales bacterium]